MPALIHYKNDVKRIVRDPIMAIMMLAPLLLITVFKLLEVFLLPFIALKTGFDPAPYEAYILSFVVLMNAGMLGIVTGFMMLDDRDGNITELLAVTPLGRSGYLINRITFASICSVVYCIIGFAVLNLADLPFLSKLFLCLLSALYAAIIGLLIFSGADDKVKGLTFAKAVNAMVLFAFADLFSLNWLTILSWFFPAYWVTAIIQAPDALPVYGIAIFVHVVWLLLLIFRYQRKTS
jgi:fluoroquinolone transport system permease protein